MWGERYQVEHRTRQRHLSLTPLFSLEIYFKDSRSIFVVFASQDNRQSIMAKLHAAKTQGLGDLSPVVSTTRTPLLSRVGTRLSMALQGHDEIFTAQRRWQSREISNVSHTEPPSSEACTY